MMCEMPNPSSFSSSSTPVIVAKSWTVRVVIWLLMAVWCEAPAASQAVAAVRKQFVPGCGYVIALPTAAPAMPKWVRVTSSWTNSEPTGDVAYVALDLDALGDAAAQAKYLTGSPSTLTVIGFENLVRVDQYTVTLD
jgi:hypothetical protein